VGKIAVSVGLNDSEGGKSLWIDLRHIVSDGPALIS